METATKNKTTALATLTNPRQKVNQLLSLKKISRQDIENLNQAERDCLGDTATRQLQRLTGTGRDSFLDKIEAIVPEATKNQLWENNQMMISNAISKFLSENGYMPSKTLIAEQTGLSRQTVVKHFKEYKTHPEHTAAVEQFKFMAPKIMASVFKVAVKGDTKAARLYFDMIGETSKQQKSTVVTEQNNYIQINNTILSQENLRQLTAEQLNQIESIITNRG